MVDNLKSARAAALLVFLIAAICLATFSRMAAAEELAPEADEALCRYGVNYSSSSLVPDSIANYNLTLLRLGWYLNYSTNPGVGVPAALDHSAMIRLRQLDYENDTYVSAPAPSEIQQLATDNPGKTWYIGNEPDRIGYQDDLEPHV